MNYKSPSKHISLTKLYEIKANQYRSETSEYFPEEVDNLILIKQSKLDQEREKASLKQYNHKGN